MPADLAVGVTLVVWATWVTAGTGGREPHRLTVLALLVLVSALLVRPWRTLPRTALVLGNGIGVAAAGVVLTAPTGFAGADEAASYVVFGQLVLVLLAWAVDTARRLALLLALLLLGVMQVAMGWLAYWGGEDATRPFQGTFFWHNPVGISLAVGAAVALVVLLTQPSPWSLLGWFAAPLTGAVCLLTTSRASALLLGGGAVVVLGLAVLQRRWLDAAKVGVVAVLTWATSLLLVGPVFFADAQGGASPLAGTAARAAAEPLEGNTEYRLVTWQLAVDVFREWPLTGAGFHGFKSAATQVSGEPQVVAHSHNGFLQTAADGGLLLALPFWAGALLVAYAVVRRLRSTRSQDPLVIGGALALLLLVLHGGMDFDWSYPSLLAALGVAVAAALGGSLARRAPDPGPARELVVAAVCVGLLVAAAFGAWDGGLDLNTPVGGTS